MNCNTNNKYNIQAAQVKQNFVRGLEGTAKVLGATIEPVLYSAVDSTGGEDVAWVRIQIKKLQQIEAQLTK